MSARDSRTSSVDKFVDSSQRARYNRPMRLLAVCFALTLYAVSASAQTARVSGRVVELGRGTPVPGATVRITGATARVTDSNGRFEFTDVVAGRYIVTVSSIGYAFRSIELAISADTNLVFELSPRVVSLDTVVVLPTYLRIKGTAVDSASGDYLLQAQATLYPGGRFIGALNGTFAFDSVPPGPVTIVVEGAEHLPVRIEFQASGDTNFQVKLGIDSVALRMIGLQVMRLEKRAQSVPYTMRSFNRNLISEHRMMTIGEFIDRRLQRPPDPRRRVATPATGACVFVDDSKVPPAMLDGLIPELIERVEVYKNGAMIRVYTKRYVSSLIGKAGLQKVTYLPVGMGISCH
jgi:hypothetical protein